MVDDVGTMIMRVANETETRHVLVDPMHQEEDFDVLPKLAARLPSAAR